MIKGYRKMQITKIKMMENYGRFLKKAMLCFRTETEAAKTINRTNTYR